jgi:hypothetical protein
MSAPFLENFSNVSLIPPPLLPSYKYPTQSWEVVGKMIGGQKKNYIYSKA